MEEVEDVMNQIGLNGQLIFHVYADSSNYHRKIINVADSLHDVLVHEFSPLIETSLITLDGQKAGRLYNDFLNFLPFFLDEEDLGNLAQRIDSARIETLVENYRKGMRSPLAMIVAEQYKRDPFGLASTPLSKLKSLQVDDNFRLVDKHLMTLDSQHLVFFVNLIHTANETDKNRPIIQYLEEATLRHGQTGIHMEYFGAPAVALANADRIRSDVRLTVTIAMISLFLLISFFYRSVLTFFLILTPAIFGGLCGIAVLTALKDEISTIALAVGSVLLGVTIDYSLHIFTHAKKAKNINQLLSEVGGATLLSSITTGVAFFALTFLSSPALFDLGVFASVSVLSAALFALIVLPHFIRLKSNLNTNKNLIEKWVGRLSTYDFHKNRWVWLVIVIVTIISFFTWRKVNFDEDMMSLNYQTPQLTQFEKNLNGISSYSEAAMFLAVRDTSFGTALNKNRILSDVVNSLKAEGIIEAYSGPGQIVPSPDQAESRYQRWKRFWNQDRKEILQGLGEVDFVNDIIQNKRPIWNDSVMMEMIREVQPSMLHKDENGFSLVTTIKSKRASKSKIIEAVSEIEGVVILDKAHMTGQMIDILNKDFGKLVNISMLTIFLILLIRYGRIELALMAFIPIIISWVWVLGLMGLIGLEFNIVNIIICTFIFGLGVDYSIFTLRGLLQDYKYGKHDLPVFKQSIIISSLTTLIGIGVLAFARHPALQSIALMAIIGILSVIIIAFTIEVGLFNFFIGDRRREGVTPFTLTSFFITVFAFSYFLFGCLLLLTIRALFLVPIGAEEKKKKTFHWLMMKFTGSLVYAMANFKKDVVGKENADFNRPAVMIANHHSFIDILILLMFDPRVLMMVKDWVYYSPFFGKSVQYADFIHTTKGVEPQWEDITSKVNDGYSIAVFPEGTRSGKFELSRFHKGAFYLAEKLSLDIQPIVLHGSNLVMPKGDDFYLKNNTTTIQFLPRIRHDDQSFGTGYKERTKNISGYFKSEYGKLRERLETPTFFKEILIKNFLYKGPVLEWYMRVKMKMERNYELLHELIPKRGRVYDLGCGYGMVSHALGMCSADREILSYDYDEEKIKVASSCAVVPNNVQFFHGDVMDVDIQKADAIILSDVLHYLTRTEQERLLRRAVDGLNGGGKLLIRDGDKMKLGEQKWTALSEFWSTSIGFNKTRNELNFIDQEFIRKFATELNLNVEVFEQSQRMSNTMFVLTK